VFEEVLRHFSEREAVELCVTIAGYNMVSRVLRALDVDHEVANGPEQESTR
jgi:alkylhydroperoxidase family enzyme